nr:MFS transporter [Staphylococcus lugdunensis]
FLTIQAIAVVLSRFYLRKYIPSDGQWHSVFMLRVLSLLVIAAVVIAFGPQLPQMIVYIGAVCIGITQALVYPTLTSYLSFVLSKVERNMLLGLFIACADLGISLGGVLMGPISDWLGFKFMYLLCASFVVIAMVSSVSNWNQQQCHKR